MSKKPKHAKPKQPRDDKRTLIIAQQYLAAQSLTPHVGGM